MTKGTFRRLVRISPRVRRRFGTAVRLVLALTIIGGMYTAFAPASMAGDDDELSAAARKGRELYEQYCISCHGQNAEGVPGRGPSLVGVGGAAADFQLSTGRMPLAAQGAQAQRKQPIFDANQIAQLSAYIQELGGGPEIPDGDLRDDEAVAAGGQLYRINCMSCHHASGNGGALSSGKFAPSLKNATDRQIYAAMLTGPQNMPVFGDNELTPEEKKAIIAYIQQMKEDQDPGGWGIGRLGPVPEFLVIFLIGIVALVFVTLWIAGKS